MSNSETMHSDLTGKDYHLSQIVRIVNQKQALFYWISGVTPVDIYPSLDYKTNKPIFVYLYVRSDTTDLYDKWCKREVDWEELNENNLS